MTDQSSEEEENGHDAGNKMDIGTDETPMSILI
jgi:hypothetical protein